MTKTALERALDHFDGKQTRLAEAIGTSQQLVSYWLNKSRPVPAEYVLRMERHTGISRHEIRPDIYPVESAPEQARAA